MHTHFNYKLILMLTLIYCFIFSFGQQADDSIKKNL